MKISKFCLTFITSLLFSILISITALCADGVIYFSDPTVEAGNNVEVQMTVQCDQEKVGEVNILLKYPAEELIFTEGTASSGGAGTIRVHGNGTSTESGKYVFSMNFATKQPGEYKVTIDSQEVYTESGAAININHLGSSTITVSASSSLNKDVLLSSLEISPGSLIPSFDPLVANYGLTVGLSVERLTINANPADTGSKVSVENNDTLKEGENDVVIYVRSEDGTKQSEYHINVLKTEGGEENVPSESESLPQNDVSTGVQLTCKGKAIKIMEPSADTQIPEGYRESKIKIDGQPVTGWISEDTEDPQYFLVYGMNDEGEVNFYRYDRKEKTIQRVFEEGNKIEVTDTEEYLALKAQYEEAEKKLQTGKMILYIAGIIALLLIGIIIYLAVRLGNVNRDLQMAHERASRRTSERNLDPEKSKRSRRSVRSVPASDSTVVIRHSTEELFKDNAEKAENGSSVPAATGPITAGTDLPEEEMEEQQDETKVLGTREQRRISRRASGVSGDTTVLRRESRRHRDENEF